MKRTTLVALAATLSLCLLAATVGAGDLQSVTLLSAESAAGATGTSWTDTTYAFGHDLIVEFTAATASGGVTIEGQYDDSPTQWAPLTPELTSATKVYIAYIPGHIRRMRARVSTVLVGGTVTVRKIAGW